MEHTLALYQSQGLTQGSIVGPFSLIILHKWFTVWVDIAVLSLMA